MTNQTDVNEWYEKEFIPSIYKKNGKKFGDEYKRLSKKVGNKSILDLLKIHGIERIKPTYSGDDFIGALKKEDKTIPSPSYATYKDKNGLPTTALYEKIKSEFGIDEEMFKL